MKRLLPCVLVALTPALAQSGDCTKPFQAPQSSGGHISMTLRAGQIDIVPTKDNALRVTCRVDRQSDAQDIKIRFAAGSLRVYGGPNKDVRYRIEVPEKTSLVIRATAGDMRVEQITGDKDIELRTGNLIVDVGNPNNYKVAEGKILAGNLNAGPFGAQKDGLFRSFRKDNSAGQYRLRVELMAGDLTLR